MTGRIIICGNTCKHNHDSVNGPTGCCPEHGPYMYFCNTCHENWKKRMTLKDNMTPLIELIEKVSYKPGWNIYLTPPDDECPVYKLMIRSDTEDSFNFNRRIHVLHEFMVPPATYKREVWVAWVFDRIRDVETHEAGEFFRVDDVREFAPHHSNGEDPYRVWHVSDWATAAKSSGQE